MLIRDVLTKILHKLSQPKLKFGAQIRRHFSHKIMLPKFDFQKAIKLLAKFVPKLFLPPQQNVQKFSIGGVKYR